jgi:hypothetical protein
LLDEATERAGRRDGDGRWRRRPARVRCRGFRARTAGTRPGGVDGRSLAGGRPGRVGIQGGGARVHGAGKGNRERKIVQGEGFSTVLPRAKILWHIYWWDAPQNWRILWRIPPVDAPPNLFPFFEYFSY